MGIVMLELKILEYVEENRDKWDKFVMDKSVNGTFLQTRHFLEYHGSRYDDSSLIFIKGNDTIVAVIPACTIYEADKKIFSAHCGSTFGGIVVADSFYNIEHMDAIVDTLNEYLKQNGYNRADIHCTSDIFAKRNNELLYYFLFQKGYASYDELSCYVDFDKYNDDIISNFSSGRRRDYKYSLKNALEFRQIYTDEEVRDFYNILCENLQKFDAVPVHSYEELIEFKNERLTENVEFYGVFNGAEMIAGSMIFLFDRQVFHTQYLAAKQEYLKLYPMNYLDTNLIQTAKDKGYRYFSFGTSTTEHGKVLNKKLAEFKEGFGTVIGINKTFVLNL